MAIVVLKADQEEERLSDVILRVINDNPTKTIQSIADLVGCSKSYVYKVMLNKGIEPYSAKDMRIETIKANPNLDARQLAEKLNVTVKRIYLLAAEAGIKIKRCSRETKDRVISVKHKVEIIKPVVIDRKAMAKYTNKQFSSMYLDE
jgi:hypothetical protein